MTFWEWAGAVWKQPGVETQFLGLQDDHGQSAPLLLWALWRLDVGGGLDPVEAAQAAVLCRSMNDAVIAPMRAARRDAAPLDHDRLLANELKAEHELFDQLAALTSAGQEKGLDPRPVAATLAHISVLWGRALDASAFEPLLNTLTAREAAHVG